ncbi:MAG: ABC transporter ATP-binding protein [Thermoplasmatota archaeon]
MSTPLLEVSGLEVEYPLAGGARTVKAVNGVSFSLGTGETLGIVGESGCGKTTIAHALCQILPPHARVRGSIRFRGQDLLAAARRRDGSLDPFHPTIRGVRWKGISMIFQGAMNAFNPVMTIGDQVTEAIVAHEDVGLASAHERVHSLFRVVGIQRDRFDSYPHELSGGTKQRAMIAMALACGPDLVVADEPTTALDVLLQDKILGEIATLQRERGMAMIMISHDVTVVAEVAHMMAIMYAGRFVEQGTTAEVFRHPAHPYTRALLQSFPSLRGPRRRLEGIPGFPPDLTRLTDSCAFAPRCGRATDACCSAIPPARRLRGLHEVACLHADAPMVPALAHGSEPLRARGGK